MPRDRVEIVRRYFEAWETGDFEDTLKELDTRITVDWSESKAPYARVYTGLAGARQLYEELRQTFEDARIDAHDLIEAGPCVAARNTAYLRGRAGIEVVARSTIVFTFDGGKIVEIRLFQEHSAALEAIGAQAG